MGSILMANCTKCGFNKKLFFGGGMSNFKENCSVPVYNSKANNILVKNILSSEETIDGDVFYNNPQMFEGDIRDDIDLQWDKVFLKRTGNFCPSCWEYSLVFMDVGCFD